MITGVPPDDIPAMFDSMHGSFLDELIKTPKRQKLI
jgi:hypothetical protein